MNEKFQKKLRLEKIIIIAMIPTIFCLQISSVFLSSVFCFAFIALLSTYIIDILPVRKSISTLKQIGATDVLDDIYPDKPTLPESKIYLGPRALVTKKPMSVVVYSDIAWVYIRVTKAFYGTMTNTYFIIKTKSGKEFRLLINKNKEEYDWLLKNIIIPKQPYVIIGYGTEQRKKYNQVKTQYKNSKE